MTEMKTTSRRDFLKRSTVLTAGAALAGGLSLDIARSAHAAGSGQIKVALIGCGGRGKGAIGNCLDADEAIKVIAVADAFEKIARDCAKGLRSRYADRVDIPDDRIFAGLDAFQKAIDCGADMIVTATPPGFRPFVYAAAVKAGKHVFMEKPCCVDAPGYKLLMETNKLADQKGLKVGVGFQRHHSPGYIECVKRIQDGAIGKLMFLQAYWNGAGIWVRSRDKLAEMLGRKPTEMEFQVNNWYHFCWLSGDNICEQHIHNLDVCNWVKGAHPVEANGMGGCSVRYSGTNKGMGQIFDHHFVEFTYVDGTKLYSQCRHIPGTFTYVGEAAFGTDGWSNCNGKIEKQFPVPVKAEGKAEAKAEKKSEKRSQKKSDGKGKKAAGVDSMVQEHMDLIAAIRSGANYNEGYYGASSSMTAVLGRMATYSGKIVKWDDAVAQGTSEFPTRLAWDAPAPVNPDSDGNYPIPVPGVFKPY